MKNKTQEEIEKIIKSKLKKLRSEIVLNSLYTNDYENSYGIDARVVQDFFDCYMEYLNELLEEKEDVDKLVENGKYYNKIFELDNIENLENFYWSCEIDLGF